MIMALHFMLALATAPGACRAIESDSILARDIAVEAPGFAQLPPEFHIGYLPASAEPRIYRGVDLQRIAKNRGIELDGLPDICFQRRTFIPQVEDIRQAMLETLGVPGAKIEISSWSQRPVPTGSPFNGSERQPETLWRGFVRYDGTRSAPVWAKARVTATMTRVVTVTEVPTGKPIQASQIRLETCEDSLLDESAARSLDQVIGYVPKRLLHAKTTIRKTQIEWPPDVAAGDVVQVRVAVGSAHLTLEARASSSGVKGSTILVRNLSSGRDFQAVVTGKDQLTVVPSLAGGGSVQ
jgi:flagella basal body P-ring formation protein FlgA